MSELLICYTFLADNLESWVTLVDNLEHIVRERHIEISRLPPQTPSKRAPRTSSNESLRRHNHTTDEGTTPTRTTATTPPTSPNGTHQTLLLFEATSTPAAVSTNPPNSDGFLPELPTPETPITRKRRPKTASLLSNATGRETKYRTRNMIIVWYDSEVQNAFEQLVRNIGVGRNRIRKARMAARMSALSRGDLDGIAATAMRSSRRGANGRKFGGAGRKPNAALPMGDEPDADAPPEKKLEQLDSWLEIAQSLCEKGAHQFLRDGDCTEETGGTRQCFRKVLELSREEARRVKEMEDKRKKEDEDGPGAAEPTELEPEEKPKEGQEETSATAGVSLNHSATIVGAGELEADDDDDVEMDMSFLRKNMRLTARS